MIIIIIVVVVVISLLLLFRFVLVLFKVSKLKIIFIVLSTFHVALGFQDGYWQNIV